MIYLEEPRPAPRGDDKIVAVEVEGREDVLLRSRFFPMVLIAAFLAAKCKLFRTEFLHFWRLPWCA